MEKVTYLLYFCILLMDLVNVKEKKKVRKETHVSRIFRKIIQTCKRLDRQLHLGILENEKGDCDLPLARAKQRMFLLILTNIYKYRKYI